MTARVCLHIYLCKSTSTYEWGGMVRGSVSCLGGMLDGA